MLRNIRAAIRNLPLSEAVMCYPLECFFFLILIFITVYRKRLSSNHEYRDRIKSQDGNRQGLLVYLKRRRGYIWNKFFLRAPQTSITETVNLMNTEIYNNIQKVKNFDPAAVYDYVNAAHPPEVEATSVQQKDFSSFPNLSHELQFHILYHLETVEIIKFALTSSRYYQEIVHNDDLWEQLWIITYSHVWQMESVKEIRFIREIFWDPLLNFPSPQYGWYRFYIAFEICWIDWVMESFFYYQN
jgi:hypothetical protein